MADNRQPLVGRSIKFLVPARSIRFLQANLSRGEPEILASYALVGAVITFGGLGYILDRFADTAPWFLIAGLLVGVSIGFYNLVKTAWRR
ncbi:MAG: AtpZ/AtpI family protein [Vicinamibacterales bacterium]